MLKGDYMWRFLSRAPLCLAIPRSQPRDSFDFPFLVGRIRFASIGRDKETNQGLEAGHGTAEDYDILMQERRSQTTYVNRQIWHASPP